jgi:hypothetical protein
VIKTTALKTDAKGPQHLGTAMKPVRFNATYDAGVSKIGCFFTIVERSWRRAIKKDGGESHPLNILQVSSGSCEDGCV